MALNPGNSVLANDAKLHQTLYHGTSSNHLDSIRKHGITPTHDGHTYVATDPDLAAEEGYHTTHGGGGKGPGAGGHAVLLHIDRNHPSVKNFKTDEGYGDGVRSTAFKTKNTIHPDGIKKVQRIEE